MDPPTKRSRIAIGVYLELAWIFAVGLSIMLSNGCRGQSPPGVVPNQSNVELLRNDINQRSWKSAD
jgi:hypothetical protein